MLPEIDEHTYIVCDDRDAGSGKTNGDCRARHGWTLLRSPGPISPETYSGHIRRRAL
jgi:hypothetical protein